MGTFFYIGICTGIRVERQGDFSEEYTTWWTETLARQVDLSLYELQPQEESLCWELRPELLEEGLIEFLQTQFAWYPSVKDQSTLLEKIRQAGCAAEIVALADLQEFGHFWGDTYRDGLYSRGPTPQWHLISLFQDGKIICEGGFGFFRYLEKALHAQKECYPLAGTMKVFVI